MSIEQGLTWTQIFFYWAGGLAAIAATIKTTIVICRRLGKRKRDA